MKKKNLFKKAGNVTRKRNRETSSPVPMEVDQDINNAVAHLSSSPPRRGYRSPIPLSQQRLYPVLSPIRNPVQRLPFMQDGPIDRRENIESAQSRSPSIPMGLPVVESPMSPITRAIRESQMRQGVSHVPMGLPLGQGVKSKRHKKHKKHKKKNKKSKKMRKSHKH